MSYPDSMDLLMRICEREGYGVNYGVFVAKTTPEDRQRWLAEERRKESEKRGEPSV